MFPITDDYGSPEGYPGPPYLFPQGICSNKGDINPQTAPLHAAELISFDEEESASSCEFAYADSETPLVSVVIDKPVDDSHILKATSASEMTGQQLLRVNLSLRLREFVIEVRGKLAPYFELLKGEFFRRDWIYWWTSLFPTSYVIFLVQNWIMVGHSNRARRLKR